MKIQVAKQMFIPDISNTIYASYLNVIAKELLKSKQFSKAIMQVFR